MFGLGVAVFLKPENESHTFIKSGEIINHPQNIISLLPLQWTQEEYTVI